MENKDQKMGGLKEHVLNEIPQQLLLIHIKGNYHGGYQTLSKKEQLPSDTQARAPFMGATGSHPSPTSIS